MAKSFKFPQIVFYEYKKITYIFRLYIKTFELYLSIKEIVHMSFGYIPMPITNHFEESHYTNV